MVNIGKIFTFLVLCLGTAKALHVTVTINTTRPLFTVDPLSPSVALGLGIFKYNLVDYMHSEKLLTLSRSLGPSYLRIGGTREDYATFQPNEDNIKHNIDCTPLDGNSEQINMELIRIADELEEFRLYKRKYGVIKSDMNVTFTGLQWDKLNAFAKCVGWNLIFGLNFLTKQISSEWDPSNAEQLLAYSDDRDYPIDWELGNEPNSYHHKSGTAFTAEQLAKGFHKLRPILNKYKNYKNSLLIGPDSNDMSKKSSQEYLRTFLNLTRPIINKATFHQYYTRGSTAILDNFTDTTLLNELAKELHEVVHAVQGVSQNIPLWLGETSSTYGGGTINITDSYANGFMWLNKLGISAISGISMVIRQTLFESNYAMLDPVFNPLPDYWLTLLYKRLVGPRVLNVTVVEQLTKRKKLGNEKGKFRIFGHCAKNTSLPDGAMTMYYLNLSGRNLSFSLSLRPHGRRNEAHLYMLTHGDDGLTSKKVALNGKILKMINDHTLPSLDPRIQSFKSKFKLMIPSKSFGFIVFPFANVRACKHTSFHKRRISVI